MSVNVDEKIKEYSELINEALLRYLPKPDKDYGIVVDAMHYSIENGGKRLRPILTLEFCNICGADIKDALPFACAVEMVHTYSLIHDDLPCMDDDNLRRGKPSCHIKFGEEYALLAGDALLTLAFETVFKNPDSQLSAKAANALAKGAGINGMIGGQVIDLLCENKKVGIYAVNKMHLLKTVALIETSAVMGCIAANTEGEKFEASKNYAKNIGLAFQIVDDILDVTGDTEKLGKSVGSDSQNNKSTYVSLLGIEKSKELVNNITISAKESLSVFGERAEFLTELADKLSTRES